MILSIFSILFSMYAFGGLILYSFKIYTFNCYLLLEDSYLRIIQTHNYCACQRLGTRTCKTWKRITEFREQMDIYKKDLRNVQWALNKLTFGFYKIT